MTTEVLRGVAEGAIKGLSDLAPGIAEYQYHSSRMNATIAIAFMIASIIAIVIGIKMGIKNDWHDMVYFGIIATGVGVFAISLIMFASEINDIYLAKYFPEKLVLRELRSLLHNY